MKITRSHNAKRNILWGIVNKVVVTVFPFIIRTLLLKVLGEEYLGLSSLFTSILQVLSLSELGFSVAMVYSMYKPIAEDDKDKICALLNLYKSVYRIIGGFIGIVGIILLPFLNHLIEGGYPQNINIYILYLIYLLNTVLSYWLFAYKTALLSAHQRSDIESNILTITNVLMNLVQIGTLILFKNYYLYIIWLPIFTLSKNIITSVIVKKLYPQYICKGRIDKESLKLLKTQLFALMGHKVGAVVRSAADNIIISMNIGLTTVAVYNNYYSLLNAVGSILNILYTSITAGIGNSIIKENVTKNYEDFKMFSFINMWLVGWFSICFSCLFQPFMILWVGEKLLFPTSTMILFVIYFAVMYMRKIVNTYKDASGMWMADVAKPYVEAIFNLLANILLVRIWGINGVLIASILSMALICIPWEAHVLYKDYFKMNEVSYYLSLAKYIIINFVVGCFTYFICFLFSGIGVFSFILKFIVCIFIPNICFFIVYNKYSEFKKCIKLISNVFPFFVKITSRLEFSKNDMSTL